MARTKTETAPQLASAYAELVKRGAAITVRALREAAGVSTTAAAEWLRANRPAQDTPPAPHDELVGAVGALWAVAVTAARDEVATDAAAREAALIAAEAEALEDLSAAEESADKIAAQLAEVQAEAQRAGEQAQADIEQLRVQLTRAQADAQREREIARTAEARASRAEATAETLQRLVDTHMAPQAATE